MQRIKEEIYKWILAAVAFVSLTALVGITITLFKEALPLLREVSIIQCILGREWYPKHVPPDYGILPLILGSVWVTLGALLVCVPLGIGSALYLSEIAQERQKAILKPIIEIFAAIPSIVYGFFGMVIVAPFVQQLLGLPVGLTAFTASIILGMMAIPIVCSISEDAISYVPREFREASYALGANRWQTLTKVVVPASASGISTSIILGMSRAIGETMVVLMVAGGAAVIPRSFFQPVRPITATIAAEMGETVVGSPHYHALFAIGLVLFIITFIFNMTAELISRRFRIRLGLGR